MKKALMLLFIISSGCTYYDPSGEWAVFGDLHHAVQAELPRRVSACGFSEEDTALIYEAVEEWNALAGQDIFVTHRHGCDQGATDFYIYNFERRSGSRLAETYLWHCEKNICPQVLAEIFTYWWEKADWYRKSTIRHELGHYLGLGHDYGKGCLMWYGAFQEAPWLCDAEFKALCRHYPTLAACN